MPTAQAVESFTHTSARRNTIHHRPSSSEGKRDKCAMQRAMYTTPSVLVETHPRDPAKEAGEKNLAAKSTAVKAARNGAAASPPWK